MDVRRLSIRASSVAPRCCRHAARVVEVRMTTTRTNPMKTTMISGIPNPIKSGTGLRRPIIGLVLSLVAAARLVTQPIQR